MDKGGGGKQGKSKGGKHTHTSNAPPSPRLEGSQLDALVPPLEPPAPSGAQEKAAQQKRDRLVAQIRSSKSGSGEERRLLTKWNTYMPARNAALYEPAAPTAIPILLLVHTRTLYLEATLRLYGRVRGIETTTLVISHHGADEGVWSLVESVRFCLVRQLLFPLASGFRGPPALKLHFAWALGHMFSEMEAAEVLYMEDDFWPTPDLYTATLWLRARREAHCPECVGSIVGEHPRDWYERHAEPARWLAPEKRSLLYHPYVGCNFNSPAGMSLPARTWQSIVQRRDQFCDARVLAYDDAIHAMQNVQGGQRTRGLEPGWLTHAFPRCLHVGRCGGVSFRADTQADAASASAMCNVTSDLEVFVRTWVVPMLPGGALAEAAANPVEPQHPRAAWRLSEGIAMCRERYMADASSGKLAGVAPSNHTMPPKFASACLCALDGACVRPK